MKIIIKNISNNSNRSFDMSERFVFYVFKRRALMKPMTKSLTILLTTMTVILLAQSGYPQSRGIQSGNRFDKLIIRNVIMIDGNGTPAQGPVDIVVANDAIESVSRAKKDPTVYRDEAHVLDGSGMYALPGLINIHAHIHEGRAGHPIPFEYLYKLWLACGITSVRDVGSNTEKTIEERRKSREGLVAAPRIFLYMRAWGNTPEEVKERVREIKQQDGDGVKIFGIDADIM